MNEPIWTTQELAVWEAMAKSGELRRSLAAYHHVPGCFAGGHDSYCQCFAQELARRAKAVS